MNLLYDSQIIASSAVSVGSKSTIFGNPVDCSDCEGVFFIVAGNSNFEAVDSSAYLHAFYSTYSSGGFALYGSSVASRSTCDSDGVQRYMGLDIYKPTKRYIKPAVYRTTGNFSIVSIKYGMRAAGTTYLRSSTAVWGANSNTFSVNISSS
jgi:hypothetical protein